MVKNTIFYQKLTAQIIMSFVFFFLNFHHPTEAGTKPMKQEKNQPSVKRWSRVDQNRYHFIISRTRLSRIGWRVRRRALLLTTRCFLENWQGHQLASYRWFCNNVSPSLLPIAVAPFLSLLPLFFFLLPLCRRCRFPCARGLIRVAIK